MHPKCRKHILRGLRDNSVQFMHCADIVSFTGIHLAAADRNSSSQKDLHQLQVFFYCSTISQYFPAESNVVKYTLTARTFLLRSYFPFFQHWSFYASTKHFKAFPCAQCSFVTLSFISKLHVQSFSAVYINSSCTRNII